MNPEAEKGLSALAAVVAPSPPAAPVVHRVEVASRGMMLSSFEVGPQSVLVLRLESDGWTDAQLARMESGIEELAAKAGAAGSCVVLPGAMIEVHEPKPKAAPPPRETDEEIAAAMRKAGA